MRTRTIIVRGLVVLVALSGIGLRLAGLDELPPGFYADEASIGYNAYSIAETGRDEHGTLLPLWFRAFGDYKNPIYIYAAVPLVKMLGPTVVAVRLVAALFGLATCALIGASVGHLVRDRWWGLGAFGVAAFLPWLVLPGRVAFEAITLPAFLVAGWLLWVQGIATGRRGLFLLSGFAHGLAFYAYSTGRIVAPMQLIVLVVSFPTVWRADVRRLGAIAAVGIFVATLLPAAMWTTNHPGSLVARFGEVSAFDPADGFGRGVARVGLNLVRYVSPHFLFADGDPNLRHHTGTGGLLYLFLLPGLVRGVQAAWKPGGDRRLRSLLWLALLFPVVPSLTHTSFHALRGLHGAAPILILAMVGLRAILTGGRPSEPPGTGAAGERPRSRVVGPPEDRPVELERLFDPKEPPPAPSSSAAGSGGREAGRWLSILIVAAGLLEVSHYTYDLIRKYPERAEAHFQAGTGEMVRFALENRGGLLSYDPALFADETGRPNQPYIHFLWWGRLEPGRFQKEGGLRGFEIDDRLVAHWTTIAEQVFRTVPAGQEVQIRIGSGGQAMWCLKMGPGPFANWVERGSIEGRRGRIVLYEVLPQ